MVEDKDKFEELMKLADRKHPTFDALYGDHKKAMKKAQKKVEEEPEDINIDTVTEHFAKFIHAYDSISKYRVEEPPEWKDIPDHHKAQFRAHATQTLEELAKQKNQSLHEIIDDLEAGRFTFEELYLTHASSSKNNSVQLYLRDKVGKMVDKYDDDNAKFWIDTLKKENRSLKKKKDSILREDLTTYVLQEALKYHQATQPEKVKKAP